MERVISPEVLVKLIEQFEFFTKKGWTFYQRDSELPMTVDDYISAYKKGIGVIPFRGLDSLPFCIITLQ